MERKPKLYALVTKITGYRTYHISAYNKEEVDKQFDEYLEFIRVNECHKCISYNECEILRNKIMMPMDYINGEYFDSFKIIDINKEFEEYVEYAGNFQFYRGERESKCKQ